MANKIAVTRTMVLITPAARMGWTDQPENQPKVDFIHTVTVGIHSEVGRKLNERKNVAKFSVRSTHCHHSTARSSNPAARNKGHGAAQNLSITINSDPREEQQSCPNTSLPEAQGAGGKHSAVQLS